MQRVNLVNKELDYFSKEAFKTLRTNLQFCGGDIKVVAITSCTENEGKSVTAMNLGMSLAEAGKKVLFVDCDLRKSVFQAKVTSEGVIRGLTYYLSKQAELADVICLTDIPGFHVIFAGPIPPNPSELLGGKEFRKLIAIARNNYDYVIIDTPPLGSVIDCAVVAESCDGTILLISVDNVSYKFAQDVKAQLEKCSCPILGVILNKVDISSKSKYGSRYGKYGKYGKYEQE